MSQQQPAPGWYPDPDDPRQRQRYWNGQQWTDDYAGARGEWAKPKTPMRAKVVVGALVLGLVGGCAVLANMGGSDAPRATTQGSSTGSDGDDESPPSRYRAKITNYTVVNPATVRFWARVTNTGTAPGRAECTVRFHDANRTYSGFDVFTLRKPLPAERSVIFAGDITVTNEGALWADRHSIKCD